MDSCKTKNYFLLQTLLYLKASVIFTFSYSVGDLIVTDCFKKFDVVIT